MMIMQIDSQTEEQTVSNYSIIDRDAIELIAEIESSTLHKMRIAAVFILLSLYVDMRYKTVKWGANACSKWLSMDREATKNLIKELEVLSFDDGEPLLEVIEKRGDYTFRKPSRRSPIYIPTVVRNRKDKESGTSVIEKMFSGGERYPVKVQRLLALIYLYANFDHHNMVCSNILFHPLPDMGALDFDDQVKMSHAGTWSYPHTGLKIWMFPDEDKCRTSKTAHRVQEQRSNANDQAIEYLAQSGLISTVRVVVNDGLIEYVASYGSSYWRRRNGDFQSKILDGVYCFVAEEFNNDDGHSVWYVGGKLYESVMPQYLVETDIVKRTLQRFDYNEESALYEIENYSK
jgi:hypothetical protein